jgi:hypothetical protein
MTTLCPNNSVFVNVVVLVVIFIAIPSPTPSFHIGRRLDIKVIHTDTTFLDTIGILGT